MKQAHKAIEDQLLAHAQSEDVQLPTLAEMVEHPKALQARLTEKLSDVMSKELRTQLTDKGKRRLDSCG